MKPTFGDLETIRRWVYRNARPLDWQRWRYHFEEGTREDVLSVLAAYQNADGGMGHALEPDIWNPHSTPLQSSTAMAVLREVGPVPHDQAIVQGLLRYLASGADFVDGRWLNAVPSNNDYPHAPWWQTGESGTHSEYNPTAILVGFILEYAKAGTPLYAQGLTLADELCTAFAQDEPQGLDPLLCVADMLHALQRAGLQERFPVEQLLRRADEQALAAIRRDADGWAGYAFRPSHWIDSPQHPLYSASSDLVERELDYLLAQRNAEGVWDITWQWAAYPKEFAISENWWQAYLAIGYVRFLDAFGRVER